MRIAGLYSFNEGSQVVKDRYADLLEEITQCIEAIDALSCKTKESAEKTMPGQILFSPVALIQIQTSSDRLAISKGPLRISDSFLCKRL